MSGNLRKSVVPTKDRLLRYLADIPKLPSPLPSDITALSSTYAHYVSELEGHVEAIVSAIDILEKKLHLWTQISSSVPESQRAVEDAAYAAMLEDDNGVVRVIERGRDSLRTIGISLKEAKLKWQQLCSHWCAPAAHPSSPRIQLPKLKLKKFNGDPKQYSTFFNCFLATIDSQALSKIEKLVHLMSLLEGRALASVDG